MNSENLFLILLEKCLWRRVTRAQHAFSFVNLTFGLESVKILHSLHYRTFIKLTSAVSRVFITCLKTGIPMFSPSPIITVLFWSRILFQEFQSCGESFLHTASITRRQNTARWVCFFWFYHKDFPKSFASVLASIIQATVQVLLQILLKQVLLEILLKQVLLQILLKEVLFKQVLLQGFNRIAAIALLFMNEEDAFWALVYIVEVKIYRMWRGIHIKDDYCWL